MSILAGCSGANELKLFETDGSKYLPTASIIENHSGIYSVDFTNKSTGFAFGGGDGITYMMNLSFEAKSSV